MAKGSAIAEFRPFEERDQVVIREQDKAAGRGYGTIGRAFAILPHLDDLLQQTRLPRAVDMQNQTMAKLGGRVLQRVRICIDLCHLIQYHIAHPETGETAAGDRDGRHGRRDRNLNLAARA